ncbi:MAG: Eco29kI family restriction endonuclease, partial [Pedosphaera parvula]|nr:Eco29kI family restriction endonuclease [Pedosphaera parvula]
LKKHGTSISATTNLKREDFKCRYMLVDEVWVALGEARLVALFRPVWNVLIEGFGSNVEGGGRESTARSVWDILHPGRKDSLAIQVDAQIEEKIVNDLRSATTLNELKAAIRIHREAKRQFAAVRKKSRDQ